MAIAPRAQRRAGLLLLMAVLNLLWLFSPRPLRLADSCGPYYPLTDRMGFMIHCDAIDFVERARFPARLLEPGEIRQARPLFVVMGTLAGYPIDRIVQWVRPGTKPNIPYYMGFLVINILCMSAAVLLFDRLLISVGATGWQTALLAVPLVCNDVTKAFFWTAHTQMFNILGPLLTIAVGYKIATTHDLAVWKFQLLALGLGVLLLAYGTFIVLLPTVVAAYWFAQERRPSIDRRRTVVVAAVAAALFFLPTAIWVGVVIHYAGAYYNHEISQYGQLVWIVDSLREGPGSFVVAWWRFSGAFVRTVLWLDVAPFVVIAVAAYVMPRPVPASTNLELQSPTGLSETDLADNLDSAGREALEFVCLATVVSLFLFFWMLGFYERRLTFSIVPPLVCYIAVRFSHTFATAGQRTADRFTFSAVAGLWVLYHVAKYGPFS